MVFRPVPNISKNDCERMVLSLLFLAIFLFLYSPSAHAVHAGSGGLVCGSCHTMHSSQGNTGMNGPSIVLVNAAVSNRGQMHRLCLQCHSTSGSASGASFPPHNEQAPKIHDISGNLVWNQDMSFHEIGSGGYFNKILKGSADNFSLNSDDDAPNPSLGYGHSVGISVAVAPPGAADGSITNFTCTSCHDPHGTSVLPGNSTVNAYRNLRIIPTGSGTTGVAFSVSTGSYIGGVTGKFGEANSYYTPEIVGGGVSIWPVYKDLWTSPAQTNFYEASANSMGRWCATCHDNWHQEVGGTGNKGASDWNRHPVEIGLNGSGIGGVAVDGFITSGSGTKITDWDHYNNDIQCDVTNGCKRLPAANAGGMSYYYADNSSDKVFCLSCHFAHGSEYLDSLRWQHASAVSSGSQTGLGINSRIGCQQCHNR